MEVAGPLGTPLGLAPRSPEGGASADPGVRELGQEWGPHRVRGPVLEPGCPNFQHFSQWAWEMPMAGQGWVMLS